LKAGLFLSNPEKAFQDISQPQNDRGHSQAMTQTSLQSPVEKITPVTSEGVTLQFR
jgi:hypothetical protein